MNILQATAEYEAWLQRQIRLIRPDLKLKHQSMRDRAFPFLRATFYRWAQVWPDACSELASAPAVLGVGDLHVENFGTWRDLEGRLVWGVNDFDEATWLPYTNDLVRLATSAILAIAENGLSLDARDAVGAILEGYRESVERGGKPFILAEHHLKLRAMAIERLRDPSEFWRKLDVLPTWKSELPGAVATALRQALPERRMTYRVVHRVAGLGSLGRERFAALASWRGGNVAREAKTLAPSAWIWASNRKKTGLFYRQILDRAVRCNDPFHRISSGWVVRRLAPDCSRIELSDLPKVREELRLLHAMGWETSNVHLGSRKPKAISTDLKKRKSDWLIRAARNMADLVERDYKSWKHATKD
jgi:uncharacterized protein (DUF2252 family)